LNNPDATVTGPRKHSNPVNKLSVAGAQSQGYSLWPLDSLF